MIWLMHLTPEALPWIGNNSASVWLSTEDLQSCVRLSNDITAHRCDMFNSLIYIHMKSQVQMEMVLRRALASELILCKGSECFCVARRVSYNMHDGRTHAIG